jgi:hypothetical protein
MRLLFLMMLSLVVCSCSIVPASVLRTSTHQSGGRSVEIEWRDARALRIDGRGWLEPGREFNRLPARAEGAVTPEVWNLQTNTAGMHVDFNTDSPRIFVRWSGGGAMPHMPATGMSGLDLYRRDDAGRWQFIANARPDTRETTRTLEANPPSPAGEAAYRLYLPLYNSVKFLEIGVESGATFAQPAAAARRPLVFYGTSIVQGGCASRPGMAHTSILGRWLDWPVINLGFSGSARMEPVMASLLGELDAEVYILDCLPNMTDDMVPGRVEAFIRQLRAARPDTPIVMVAHLKPLRAPERNRAYRALFEQLQAEGMKDLYYIHGEDLLRGPEEGTVDGIHPTDLGFLQMAEAHERVLRPLLGR